MIPFSFQKSFPKGVRASSKKICLITTVSALALMIFLTPESWASDTVTITGQLDKVTKLTSGSVAKTGLIVGTISSAIMGLFKNSWVIFISSIGIGLGLSYYLEYLKAWVE